MRWRGWEETCEGGGVQQSGVKTSCLKNLIEGSKKLVFDLKSGVSPLMFKDLVFNPLIFRDLVFIPLIFKDLVFNSLIFKDLKFNPLIFRDLVFIHKYLNIWCLIH